MIACWTTGNQIEGLLRFPLPTCVLLYINPLIIINFPNTSFSISSQMFSLLFNIAMRQIPYMYLSSNLLIIDFFCTH